MTVSELPTPKQFDSEGHEVFSCVSCGRTTNVVFYVGDEDATPAWACSFCAVTYEKPKK